MSTEKNAFKAGDIVFSQQGHAAEFVAATGGDYIVRPIFEDEDGEHAGDVETWRKVYRSAPAPKLDAETAKAEARLQSLKAECAAYEAKAWQFQHDETARRDRIKLHEELGDLDRYLSGQITHYVAVHDYNDAYVEVIPVGQTIESYADGSNRGMLMLWPSSGYGGSGLRWTVSYRKPDNRCDSYTRKVFPCCGEEEANAKVREILSHQIEKELASQAPSYSVNALVANCQKFGVPVPQSILDGITARDLAAAEKERSDLAEKLAASELKIASLKAA